MHMSMRCVRISPLWRMSMHDNLLLKDAENMLNLTLPTWEELPLRCQSKQVRRFLQERLGLLFPEEEEILTAAMLQNYLRWGVLPKVEGRIYRREHVAWLVVICLLKHVLKIDQVKRGIELQKALMPSDIAYEAFRAECQAALQGIGSCLLLEDCQPRTYSDQALRRNQLQEAQEGIHFPALQIDPWRLAVGAACQCLAWHMVTTIALRHDGLSWRINHMKNIVDAKHQADSDNLE